jgi:hypothetical protein
LFSKTARIRANCANREFDNARLLPSLSFVVAIGAASSQGYYDRVYRGASPDPTDNRYDARPELTGRRCRARPASPQSG